MPGENSEKCGNCKFYDKAAEHKDYSECRRYPPTFSPDVTDGGCGGPIVFDSGWCGEWVEAKR